MLLLRRISYASTRFPRRAFLCGRLVRVSPGECVDLPQRFRADRPEYERDRPDPGEREHEHVWPAVRLPGRWPDLWAAAVRFEFGDSGPGDAQRGVRGDDARQRLC